MNLSDSQNFQQIIKLQRLVHITKKNYSLSKENYRLAVSILTSLFEIFEKIVDNQLSELKTKVFSDVHSAFRPGYTTQYVLMNLVEKWKSALDTSKSSSTLLMDLSKAFDCIPQDLLLAKLKAYDIEEVSLALIASYLRNREQFVNICGYCRDIIFNEASRQ